MSYHDIDTETLLARDGQENRCFQSEKDNQQDSCVPPSDPQQQKQSEPHSQINEKENVSIVEASIPLQISRKNTNNIYSFPGNMELAEIHRKANSLGAEEYQNSSNLSEADNKQSNNYCPCCGKSVKNSNSLSYFCLSKSQALQSYGVAIPQYFMILKLNILVLVLVTIFYTFEFIVTSDKLCNNVSQFQAIVGNIACMESFGFYITPEIVLKQIFDNLKYGKFTALLILLTFLVVVYLLLTFGIKDNNNSKKNQGDNERNIPERSLFLKHIPEQKMSIDGIKSLIQQKLFEVFENQKININVESVCRVADFRQISTHFEKCIDIYEELSVKKRDNIEITQTDFNQANAAYNELKRLQIESAASPSSTAIVTFTSIEDFILANKAFKHNRIFIFANYFKLRAHSTKKTPFINSELMIALPATHIQDIKWANVGQSVTEFVEYYFYQICVIMGVISGLGSLLNRLIQMQSDESKIDNSSSETFASKLSNMSVSLGLLVIEKGVLLIISRLSKKSRSTSRTKTQQFTLHFSLIFLLLYYVTIPCFLFFMISDTTAAKEQQDKVTRTASFLNEILVQLASSLIFAVLDYQYLWGAYKANKVKKLFQLTGNIDYCQMRLNVLMQKPDFSLEKRLLLVFKLLAFSGFFVFICPYATPYLIIGLIALYLLDKLLLLKRYTLLSYRLKSYIHPSSSMMITWMFMIILSVFFLTESEEINFTLQQGLSDQYALPKHYYTITYVLGIVTGIAHVFVSIVLPGLKANRELKKAIEKNRIHGDINGNYYHKVNQNNGENIGLDEDRQQYEGNKGNQDGKLQEKSKNSRVDQQNCLNCESNESSKDSSNASELKCIQNSLFAAIKENKEENCCSIDEQSSKQSNNAIQQEMNENIEINENKINNLKKNSSGCNLPVIKELLNESASAPEQIDPHSYQFAYNAFKKKFDNELIHNFFTEFLQQYEQDNKKKLSK